MHSAALRSRPLGGGHLATLAIALAAAAPTHAQDGLDSPAAERARPRLIAESASIAPGQTVLIGVTFDIEPGWHTYWHGLNDTVPGPLIELEAPEGFEIGAIQWPAPHRYIQHGLLDHIYERQVTLVAPLTAPSEPAELPAGRVEITARVNWTVCSDICLMADATLDLPLPISEAAAGPSRDAPRFAAARRRLPRPLRPGDQISASREDERIEIRAPGADRLAFYPHEKGPALADLVRDGEARADALELRLDAGGADLPLAGVLEVWRDGSRESQLIELRIGPDGAVAPVEAQPLPAAPGAAAEGA